MKILGKIVCLAVVLSGFAYAAQDINKEQKKEAFRDAIGIKIVDPSLTSPVGLPSLGLQLTTEKKDKKAKAIIGLRIGNDFFFDTKFSAPLDDVKSEVESINLDGLAKSSVMDVGIHYLSWNPKMDVREAKKIKEEYVNRHPSDKDFVLTLNNLKSEPDLRQRFLTAIIWKQAYFAALRAKIGRQDFAYDDSNFKEYKEQKTSVSLEVAVGVLFPSSGYIGFNFETQKFYEAGKSVDLIVPYQEGPIQQIKKYVMSPPGKRNRNKFQIEYRKTIGSFGMINPKISYFPKERIALVELPVYLFKSPDEGLNGGVNLNWDSKDGGRFGLALFVGSTFGITPR